MDRDTPQHGLNNTRANRWHIAALVAIMVVAAALRLVKLDVSFYVEEILTHKGAVLPWARCFTHRFYPIYYLLGHVMLYIGDTEGLLRLPSVMAGVATIPFMYSFVAANRDRATGLLAALFLAVNPCHLEYTQDARYYGVVIFAVVLMLWALDRAIDRGGWRYWLVYSLACNLGTGTHLAVYPVLAVTTASAAFVLLVHYRGRPFRARMRLALLICLCSALGGTVTAATAVARGNVPTSFGMLDSDQETAAGDPKFDPGALERHGPFETDTFRLTVPQYHRFVRELMGSDGLGWWLMAGLCLIGLGALVRAKPHLAAVLFCIIFLVPVPFLFRDVNHWYVARYFASVIPSSLALAAIGIAVVADLVRTRLLARGSSWARANGLAALAAVAFLCVLTPGIARGVSTHYSHMPRSDWRGMADYMRPMMRPGDVIVTIGTRRLHGWLRHYLHRDMYWDMTFGSRYVLRNALDGEDLAEIMTEFPDRNLWVIAHSHGLPTDVMQIGMRTFEGNRRFGFVSLWWRGAPTTNLAAAAGFEGMREGYPLGEFSSITGVDEAYEGQRAARICVPAPEGRPRAATSVGDKPLRAAIRIPLSQERIALRNGRFDAWRESEPVGWRALPAHAARVRRLDGMDMLESAVELLEADMESGISQPVASSLTSGSIIEVRASGYAEEPGALAMVVRFDAGPAGQWFEALHPGSRQWEPMHLAVPVPDYALPGSLAVEFRRPYEASGTVAVDDVSLTVRDPRAQIAPGQPCVLSLALRCSRAEPNRKPFYTMSRLGGETLHAPCGPGPVGQIALTGLTAEGERFHHVLGHFGGTADWKTLVLPLEDDDIPPRAVDLAVEVLITYTTKSTWVPPLNPEDRFCTEVIELFEGSGTVWVDNVQVEAGTRPTPLVRGTRLPHDELLATLGPAS